MRRSIAYNTHLKHSFVVKRRGFSHCQSHYVCHLLFDPIVQWTTQTKNRILQRRRIVHLEDITDLLYVNLKKHRQTARHDSILEIEIETYTGNDENAVNLLPGARELFFTFTNLQVSQTVTALSFHDSPPLI
jgi:hypothetical protein